MALHHCHSFSGTWHYGMAAAWRSHQVRRRVGRRPRPIAVYCQAPGVVRGAVGALQAQDVKWHLPCLHA